MSAATVILGLVLAYLAVGLVFGVAFVTRGAPRLDPGARDGPIGFRLLILPGSAALWPYLAIKWIRARGGAREEAG